MTVLHVEFFPVSSHQDVGDEDPIGSANLTVTGVATSGGSQITVPGTAGAWRKAVMSVSDVPVYVDIAASPDPTTDPRHLIVPGQLVPAYVQAGHLISAVLASDYGTAPAVTVNQQGAKASFSIARPADTNAYTANDVIGSATGSTAGVALAFGSISGEFLITSTRFEIDVSAIPSGMTSFRLYLYNVTPPSALGDNAAWDIPSGDRVSFLGYVDLGTPVDLGSTLYVEANGMNKQITLPAGGTIYGYLTTAGGYTPGSGDVFKGEIHGSLV